MDVDITIKNYRCFPDSRPARISLRKGFTAFVGTNNSGKSSLLKFFFEFRNLFQQLSHPSDDLLRALLGSVQAFSLAPSVLDVEDLFCNRNDHDLQIQLQFVGSDQGSEQDGDLNPRRLDITIPRTTNQWRAEFHLPSGQLDVSQEPRKFQGTKLWFGGLPKVELASTFEICRALAEVLYIGPFRNAINIGASENYFDIRVGQAFITQWRQWKSGDVTKQNEAA